MLDLFVACAPGLEPLLARELAELGLTELRSEPGGVVVRTPPPGVSTICLHSGLANHVRLRVGDPFEVRHFDKLVRKTAALPWGDLLRPGTRVVAHAVCRKSRLYHSNGVAERVEAGIAKAIGAPVEGTAEVAVAVRIIRDRCTLSLDLSGEALHRRGWRQQTAKAPLREDLARALLVVSGWTPQRPLFDPMMGSGTIVIEAATIARRMAPGLHRRFAFEQTKLANLADLADLRDAAEAAVLPSAGVALVGRDQMQGALEAAGGNAERAGVGQDVHLSKAAMSEPWPALEGATVVTNPPYGIRVGQASSVHELYAQLGEQTSAAGWSLAVVIADRRFVRSTGMSLEPKLTTDHGGIKVSLYASRAREG
ncbi:MAG: class I SAM-dependent RNA methyltransferase [Nannocystaceae bacterium]|nr:class I SAM-dependent RNA methyltransferase [bacterium]